MKIAILGYGRMGKAIEILAKERGHDVVAIIDNENEWHTTDLSAADVAIDFSQPHCAVDNIGKCFNSHLPIVVGTTGWYDSLQEIIDRCNQQGQTLFVASNFSIGMNMMFELNQRLAKMMKGRTEYTASITETHHIHKLDAPSGTAITLAKDIIENNDDFHNWELTTTTNPSAGILPITSIRQGEVPGIHEVVYDSPIDTITIRHEAKNRQGLAMGAILAAEYVIGRKGYFTMHDLIKR